MADRAALRGAIRRTIGWYVAVGVLSSALALVPMPARGNPCVGVPDPGWLAWLYRDVWWFALGLTLPVAVAVTALIVWRFPWPAARGATVGVATGLLIALALLSASVLTAYCQMTIDVVPR